MIREVAWLGIDPGLGGAVAVIVDNAPGALGVIYDTPTLTVKGPTRQRREYDVPAMARLMRGLAEQYQVQGVALERSQPMPGKRRGARRGAERDGRPGHGAIASFSLGLGYGLWYALVVAGDLPLVRAAPQTWRASMLAGLARGKEAGRQVAAELVPVLAGDLTRKKDYGRADAVLLALYAQRVIGQPLRNAQFVIQ